MENKNNNHLIKKEEGFIQENYADDSASLTLFNKSLLLDKTLRENILKKSGRLVYTPLPSSTIIESKPFAERFIEFNFSDSHSFKNELIREDRELRRLKESFDIW